MAGFIETIKKAIWFSDPVYGQIAPTEVEPTPMPNSDFNKEFGDSGTPIVYGYIDEEKNSQLKWTQGAKTYDEMRKTDAQVNASLLVMELPIRATRWYVEPAYNDEWQTEQEDQDIANFIEKALFEYMDNTRDDLLREVLTMLPFGFSVFEKVFDIQQTDNGEKVILKKMAYRKQSTISQWVQQDKTPWITQTLDAPTKGGENKWLWQVSIPAQKLVIFTNRREGDNYEWVSVLRSAYKHRYIKDKLYKFDAIRHERQGVGIPVMYLPKNATQKDKEVANSIVKNIRATEQTGIVMPWPKADGWEFEYADLKTAQSTNFKDSIEHHNREIVKNILAQFLELGNTESGSRALGESQSSFFLMSLEAVARYVCDTFDKHVIKQLVDLNFDTNRYPSLKFESLEATDKSKVVDMISTLVGGGILQPDETIQEYVRDLLDLPAQEIDAEADTISEDDMADGIDEMPSDTEDAMDDNELSQLEWELDNMPVEDWTEQEYAEIIGHISDIYSEMVDAYSCAFRAPMSEETKRKISEALKKKWGTAEVIAVRDRASKALDDINNKIDWTRREMERSASELRSGIQHLRSISASIPRGKAGAKQRAEVKKQVETLREHARQIRQQKKALIEYRKNQRDRIKEMYRQSKKEITQRDRDAKSLARQQEKAMKQAQRASQKAYKARKTFNECGHNHNDDDVFFDNAYFNELSSIVNNDFIKSIQNDK